MKMKNLKVVELFAGVGGFRLGLEKNDFKVIWSNQFEPKEKKQYASLVYTKNFGSENHSNIDINDVDIDSIPNSDLICAGFPCQDYSVATINAKGIVGEKGKLWWAIMNIIFKKRPPYLLLENVDRLLISPSKDRGKDFEIILKSLNNLGYAVEWRVLNGADYGFPQKRKRIYIFAYHKNSKIYQRVEKNLIDIDSVFRQTFPCNLLEDTMKTFNLFQSKEFLDFGLLFDGKITTVKTVPNYDNYFTLLRDVIIKEKVADEFYISDIEKWTYLKGNKTIVRTKPNGETYNYSEGKMSFPDSLDKASRTIITAEGGQSPSRFKHVIDTEFGLRRLVPVELERLNGFCDDWTKIENITDGKRAFLMGNALLVGVIKKLGKAIEDRINI